MRKSRIEENQESQEIFEMYSRTQREAMCTDLQEIGNGYEYGSKENTEY